MRVALALRSVRQLRPSSPRAIVASSARHSQSCQSPITSCTRLMALADGSGVVIFTAGFGNVAGLLGSLAKVVQIARVQQRHLVRKRAQNRRARSGCRARSFLRRTCFGPSPLQRPQLRIDSRRPLLPQPSSRLRVPAVPASAMHPGRSACCSRGLLATVWRSIDLACVSELALQARLLSRLDDAFRASSVGAASLSRHEFSSNLRCTSRSRTGAAARRILLQLPQPASRAFAGPRHVQLRHRRMLSRMHGRRPSPPRGACRCEPGGLPPRVASSRRLLQICCVQRSRSMCTSKIESAFTRVVTADASPADILLLLAQIAFRCYSAIFALSA